MSKTTILGGYIYVLHVDRGKLSICSRVEKENIIKKYVSNQLQLYGVSELVLATTTEILVNNDSLGEALKSKLKKRALL